jgi:hypothetical protein
MNDIPEEYIYSNPHPLPLSQKERGARSRISGTPEYSDPPRPLGEGLGVRVQRLNKMFNNSKILCRVSATQYNCFDVL